MRALLVPALRSGLRAALAVALLQATVAVALAAALPEVGHVHPDGAPAHVHALIEVGGVGVAVDVVAALATPTVGPPVAAFVRAPQAPRPRVGRTRLGRDPPRSRPA